MRFSEQVYATDAKLINTRLTYAIFHSITEGEFDRADLSGSYLSLTSFDNSDLSEVRGLETLRHEGPSTIGIDTLYLSQGKLPETFLRSLSDKVLLCCSKSSLTSWWVDNEVGTALEKEQQLMKERGRKVQVLIPLNLDGFVIARHKRHERHKRQLRNFPAASCIMLAYLRIGRRTKSNVNSTHVNAHRCFPGA